MTGMMLLGLGLGAVLGWVACQVWQARSPRQPPPDLATRPRVDEVAHLREQLRQTELAYQVALELSQFKGNFLARTAHELRSPMNGLIGMHQLILADLSDSPEEEREFIAQANESALKMVRILDEVIDASKVSQGTIQWQPQPMSLVELFQAVYQAIHLHAKNRNLQLVMVPPDASLVVRTDPFRLRQVLVSLVDAAIAQMNDGEISVQVLPPTGDQTAVIQIATPVTADQWLTDLTQPPTTIHQNTVIPIDKDQILQLAQQPFPDPGFVFAIARSLMESMQGSLKIVSLADQPQVTHIRCTIAYADLAASVD